MTTPTDLDRLAHQADEALEAADRRRAAVGSSRFTGRRIAQGLLAALLVLVVLLLQTHFAWTQRLEALLFPERAAQQGLADMRTVLEAARAAVEAARASSGSLPEALPSAAHAALVRYERIVNTYRLSMTDGHLLATMESDGTLDIQKVGR
jgi:hypothetical protein